jgi:SAM-dependent methyltransferase
MAKVTHKMQRDFWNKEHKTPSVLLQMDSEKPSSGVTDFFDFLKKEKRQLGLNGLEMGCGKGRNSIWLALQPEVEKMFGFDFSPFAIETAAERALKRKATDKINLRVADATLPWPYPDGFFDFAIDCFASTDIETPKGRQFAIEEIHRVLKPGGFLLVYTLTPEDEFHKEMIEKSPAEEKNAFYHTTGKFEKTFDDSELAAMYNNFSCVKRERIHKVTKFFGKDYNCHHFLAIFQKSK